MFQVNDTIMYGSEGVCKITDISEKRIEDKTIEYLILKPLYQNKALVYVPRNSKKLREKMRELLTESEVKELLSGFANFESIDIQGTRERKQTFQRILQSCDYKELTRLVKTLCIKKQEAEKDGKKLPMWEERIRKDAEKILYSEFAYVLQVEPEQVAEYIDGLVEPTS